MSTCYSIHLFDSSEFFYRLHSNPSRPIPIWAAARDQIDRFFLDFHRELLNRVSMHMAFKAVPPFSTGVNFQGFSKKDQFLLTGHYLLLCWDVKDKIELKQMAGNRQVGLFILQNEINMFISLLTVIQTIIDPNGFFTHQDMSTRSEKEANASTTSDLHFTRKETVECSSGKEKPQFSKTKIVLELKKNRCGSRSISSSSSSGRSTPTDSGISSDDEVELKNEIEIESTDDDFEAYSEEIHNMAIDTSDLPPIDNCDIILEVLIKEKMSRERLFDNFCEAEFATEFSLSSTTIDPSEFFRLDAYQKLLKQNR